MNEKRNNLSGEDQMKDEYDFSEGVRGKYTKQYKKGTNIVVLEPDVAEVFPDSTSVNEALRTLVRIARKEQEEGIPSS